ncbi:MAG: hypothetical protein LBG45_03530 [Dysgonamonadaceae bacterium]|jgi:hypothetical protein|nr:hypothetical protein [Dysgonamonadaceae bacterium]
MKKEKYHIEYIFDKAGKSSLWEYISSMSGLEGWFADKVSVDGKIYTFTWNAYSAEAEIVGINQNNYIRFHWLEDENPVSFFEFRLHKNELTGGIVLEITDFAEEHEKEDAINLWETEVRSLRRILGL